MPREDFTAKIRAAVAARPDPDHVVIARTDARSVDGLDEAVSRANAALEAGADIAFVEAIPSLDELAAVPRRVNGPCVLNVVRAGKTLELNLLDAEAMSCRLAILPSLLLGAMKEACDAALATVKATNQPPSASGGLSIRDRFRRFGSDEWDALRTRSGMSLQPPGPRTLRHDRSGGDRPSRRPLGSVSPRAFSA